MDAQSKSHLPGTVSGAAGTRRALSAELIAILGVGATLGVFTLGGMHGIRADMRDIRVDMRDVRVDIREMGARLAGVEQRVARLEGLFEGLRESIDARWPPSDEEKG